MIRNPLAPFLASVLLVSAALAQTDDAHDLHDEHDDHAHSHGHVHHDESRHEPAGAHSHAGHAHPGIDLSHPIVVESPLPETKLRFNYHFSEGDEGTENELELEAEYAFTQNFSIEAVLPYVFANPDEGDSENGLADSILAFKFASYDWVDQHVLPAIGLEVILPTGDDEKGIGSDHVLELEPFVRVGFWTGPFEFIATAGLGIPLNQTDEEADEEEFEFVYGFSTLYHITPNLQALLELTGESVFGDEDSNALYLSPGVTFQPFADKSINLGLGATIPISNDRDFDYAINVMTIIHF